MLKIAEPGREKATGKPEISASIMMPKSTNKKTTSIRKELI